MIIHFFPCIVSCVDVDWFPEWQSLTASELPFVGISHRVEAGSWLIPTSPLKNDVHCMVRTRDLRSSYGLTHSMCQGFFSERPLPLPLLKDVLHHLHALHTVSQDPWIHVSSSNDFPAGAISIARDDSKRAGDVKKALQRRATLTPGTGG